LAVAELAELADGLAGCGEVVSVECLFVWNFHVTRSAVLAEAERKTRPNMTVFALVDCS